MAEPDDLSDRVALVTGGGGGIGAALADRLAARGARVVVVDLDPVGAGEVAARIGGVARCFDVGSRPAWDDAVAEIVAELDGIDLVALNAGVMSRPKGVAMDDDDPLRWMDDRYDLVRSVNLDGVVYGVLATVPRMAARDGGRIVVTASMSGLDPRPEDPAYTTTKAGVIALVQAVAPALAERGVAIGAVCPAAVDTSLVPPDVRAGPLTFAPPDHVAAALETVLGMDLSESGGVWVTRGVDDPLHRHEFAPAR